MTRQTGWLLRSLMIRCLAATFLLLALPSCALLPSFGTREASREQTYTLAPELAITASSTARCDSVALGDTRAAPGYRSSRMAYSTAPFEISYFAYARWADSVARLLRQPLQRGFEQHGGFEHVVSVPAMAPTRYRVELTDMSLIQRFASAQSEQSVVEVAANLRVFSINPNTLLDQTALRITEEALGDPASGVAAANRAVARLIEKTAAFAHQSCLAHGAVTE